MASDAKAQAAAAKARGNSLFAKKTPEAYQEALTAYEEAIGHDPDDHVFYANCAACHIELATNSWEPKKKVQCLARALKAARECTTRGATWAKGYVRQSTAEFEVIGAVVKWEERKKQDEKWRLEDEKRAEQDLKEGREPLPPRKQDPDENVLDGALRKIVEGASYNSCEISCRAGLELEPTNEPLRTRLQSLRDVGHATDETKDQAMCDKIKAAEVKALGNAAFTGKKWKEASDHYTKALSFDPFDHVFYSNRSACYAEQEEYEKALKDAERCIALNPQFAKGYSRQAHALFHVGRYPDMEAAATEGLRVDGSNVALQDLLKQAQVETKETLDVQKAIHKLRVEKRQDAKLQGLMSTLNMGGQNVQMFNPGSFSGENDISSLLSGLGGGGGGGAFGGSGKARMTEEQMRAMARAMTPGGNAAQASAPATAPAPAPAAGAGPNSFAPP